jgi:hypothetical protein
VTGKVMIITPKEPRSERNMNQKVIESVNGLKPEGKWVLVKAYGSRAEFPSYLMLKYKDEQSPNKTVTQIIHRIWGTYRVTQQINYVDKRMTHYREVL